MYVCMYVCIYIYIYTLVTGLHEIKLNIKIKYLKQSGTVDECVTWGIPLDRNMKSQKQHLLRELTPDIDWTRGEPLEDNQSST